MAAGPVAGETLVVPQLSIATIHYDGGQGAAAMCNPKNYADCSANSSSDRPVTS